MGGPSGPSAARFQEMVEHESKAFTSTKTLPPNAGGSPDEPDGVDHPAVAHAIASATETGLFHKRWQGIADLQCVAKVSVFKAIDPATSSQDMRMPRQPVQEERPATQTFQTSRQNGQRVRSSWLRSTMNCCCCRRACSSGPRSRQVTSRYDACTIQPVSSAPTDDQFVVHRRAPERIAPDPMLMAAGHADPSTQ